MTTLFIQVDN